MIAAIWILAALGLLMWTLMAWGLHAVLLTAPGWSGDVKPWLGKLPLQAWLDTWLPGWRGLAEALLDLIQAMFALVGSTLGAYTPWLVWGVWTVGTLTMLGLAALLHVIVRAATGPTQPVPAR